MAEAPRRAPRRREEALDLDFGDPNRVAGTVERVTFHSEETGFCVLRVNAARRREPVTVVGTAASVGPGEFVEANGVWVNDRSYGLQFRAEHLRVVPPSTLEGIEKYLGSGMIRGIGPHFAAQLVRVFGAEVFEVIENDPARLRELPGIGPKRQAPGGRRVGGAEGGPRDHGLPPVARGGGRPARSGSTGSTGTGRWTACARTPTGSPSTSAASASAPPTRFAQSIGFDPDSIPRARAGLRHVLQEFAAEGHCAGEREALVSTAAELLEVDAQIVEGALARELSDGELVDEARDGDSWIYLPILHRSERGAANHLGRLLAGGGPPWGDIDPEKALPWVEQRVGFELSDSQRAAVARTIRERVSVITGGPGVGKTTIVNAVLHIVRAKGIRARLCAPTGRAAKRLAESNPASKRPRSTGSSSSTRPPEASGTESTTPSTPTSWSWTRCRWWTSCSRTSSLRAVPEHAAVLLVGDVDQLPSVGPGSVLAEIIGSDRVPTARLTEIFRQGESSRIVVNAHRINRGESPEYPPPPSRSEGSGAGAGSGSGAGTRANADPSDFYVIPVRDAEEARDRAAAGGDGADPAALRIRPRWPTFRSSPRGGGEGSAPRPSTRSSSPGSIPIPGRGSIASGRRTRGATRCSRP